MALLTLVSSPTTGDDLALPATPGLSGAPARMERLLQAAQRHSYDPFEDVDWSVAIDDSAMHLPADHLPLFGTAVWEAMTELERRTYSRHECAALFGTIVWLENLLMGVLVQYLYGLRPDHPSHRYLLVEMADECRHSAMFGEYVRRAGTPAYRPSLRLRSEGDIFRRTQGLVSSFIGILAAEELVDVSNRATMRAAAVHPLPRALAKVHVAEESRHRSFAKSFVRDEWPRLGRLQKVFTAAAAPVIVFSVAESMVNPNVYRTLGIGGGYVSAMTNPHHWRRVARDLRPFTTFLGEIGVINGLTRPAWVALGLIDSDRAGIAGSDEPAPRPSHAA